MLDLTSIATLAVAVTGAAAAVVAVLIARRHPSLKLSLMHATLPVVLVGQTIEVSLLLAAVENKKHMFGDSAKGMQCNVVFTGYIEGDPQTKWITNPIPWIANYPEEVTMDQIPKNGDYPGMLERHVFDRRTRLLPQGHHEMAVVFYSVRALRKVYYASNPPVPLNVPTDARQMKINPIRVEIAGSNVPSTMSDPTYIMINSDGVWTVPSSITELAGPDKIRNLGFQIGLVKRKQKIIPWAEGGTVKLRDLALRTP